MFGSFEVTGLVAKNGSSVFAGKASLVNFYPIRVNAGGPALTDSNGTVWSADTAFLGGDTYARDGLEIGRTNDDALFQTERNGRFGYSFDLPNGVYEVRLGLAEVFWQQPRQRVFHVKAERRRVLRRVDLAREPGFGMAAARVFRVPVIDGALDLRFLPVVDGAKVSWISVNRVAELNRRQSRRANRIARRAAARRR